MVQRSQKDVWKLTPWLMIALLLGNFVLMAFDARDTDSKQRVIRVWAQTAADFVQSPVTYMSSGVSGYFQRIASIRSAQSENEQLKQKIQELEVELKNRESSADENERLKSLLQLKEQTTYKTVLAQIIGRDTSAWFDTSIINRGTFDGVRLGMPIVTDGGLVGRVISVSPVTAQIALVTNDKSGAGGVIGELENSNALGVVNGTSEGDLLRMDYVAGSIEVKVGETVYTTGQDGIYPPGLKLGEIVRIDNQGSSTVTQQIYIKPSAKLYAMQEVAVLLYEPPPRPKFENSLANTGKKQEQ